MGALPSAVVRPLCLIQGLYRLKFYFPHIALNCVQIANEMKSYDNDHLIETTISIYSLVLSNGNEIF